MPVVVMQPSGHTTISGSRHGPNSHLALAIFVLLCINPLFGLIATVFACHSRHIAPMDWDGARVRGKIAMFFSIAGIIITVIVVIVLVLIFFTKDGAST